MSKMVYKRVRGWILGQSLPGAFDKLSHTVNDAQGVYLNLAVDLHRSKLVISLVIFNLHFHCFQG